MVFMILLLLLLSGYVAVSVIASYWLLLAIGVLCPVSGRVTVLGRSRYWGRSQYKFRC